MYAMNDIAFKQFNEKALVPCHHCGRTFLPDSLKRHQNRCTADRPFKPLNRNKKKPEKPQAHSFDNQVLPAIKNRHSKKVDLDEMMGGARNKNKHTNNSNQRRNKNPYGAQKRKVQKPVPKPITNYYEDSNVSEFSDEQDSQDYQILLKSVEKPRMASHGRRKSNQNMRKVGRPAKASKFNGIGGDWETNGTYTYCRPKGGDRAFYGWGSDKSYSKSNLGSTRQAPTQQHSQNKKKKKLYGNNRQQNKQSSDNLSNTQGSNAYGRSGGRPNHKRNGANTGRGGNKGTGANTGRGTGRRGKSPMKGHRKPKVNKMLDDFINETFGTSEKSTPRNKSNNARNGRRGKEKVKRVSPIHISKIISPLYVSRSSFPCSPISSKFHKYRLSPQPIIPLYPPYIPLYCLSHKNNHRDPNAAPNPEPKPK